MNVSLDTLVIGGGVQGLWILKELVRRNYRACLVTNGPLGAGQTLQSHAYLHRGHLYKDRHLVKRITEAQPAWQELLAVEGVRSSPQNPVWLLPSGGATEQLETWRTRGLSYRETPLPEIFGEGDLAHGANAIRAFETEEVWLNGEALISALSANVLPAIRTGHVETIEIRKGGVQQVHVTMANGEHVTFNPKFVVLAAGVGNQGLLTNALSFGRIREGERLRSAAARIQRLRTSQMVVVRGRNLPPLGCIAPRKLFLVSQKDGADTVWLNSYEVDDVAAPRSAATMPAVDPLRLETSLSILHSAVPSLKTMDVKYGVYTCLKSERNVNHGGVPSAEHVEHLGSPALNMRVVWPSKLTLAPVASKRVVDLIDGRIAPSSRKPDLLDSLPGIPPPVGASNWRTAHCTSLETLRARHGLN